MRTFHLHHLNLILQAWSSNSAPIDSLLRRYFVKHKALGSHDRRFITDIVYRFVRFYGMLQYLAPNASIDEQLQRLETLPNHLLSMPLHHQMSFPETYFSLLTQSLGQEQAIAFCQASNEQAPITIRVNALKTTQETLYRELSASYKLHKGSKAPYALIFEKRLHFLSMSQFRNGLFEVQDEASQLVSAQVLAKPGDHVLDLCAGSGGKTLAIAPCMQGKGQLYLYDIRPAVLQEAKLRLRRAGVQNAKLLTKETLEPLRSKMDWVLVDAPCSGSGTLRRNPDMKWRFSLEAFHELLRTQSALLAEGFSFVKQGGHLVYATCSVLSQENQEQIDKFLYEHRAKLVQPFFQSMVRSQEMDGFFAAVLQKS